MTIAPETPQYLVIELDNSRPISLRQLGQLYTDLARDYRQFSGGRELLIDRILHGSIITYLIEAVAVIGGANTIITFGKSIAGWLSNSSKVATVHDPIESEVLRSAERLADLATKTKSRIRLKCQSNSGGLELLVDMSPTDAKVAKKKIAAAKKLKASGKTVVTELSLDHRTLRQLSPNSLGPALSKFASLQSANPHSPEYSMIIEAIVQILIENHMNDILLQIADDLDGKNASATADLIRDAVRKASKNGEPPLLTSF